MIFSPLREEDVVGNNDNNDDTVDDSANDCVELEMLQSPPPQLPASKSASESNTEAEEEANNDEAVERTSKMQNMRSMTRKSSALLLWL